MKRELPVRIREGLGVQLPRATRLVIGFTDEEDARRVMAVLPKRFGKYGLTIHQDKTRRVPFSRGPRGRKGRGNRGRGTDPGRLTSWGSATTGGSRGGTTRWSRNGRQPAESAGSRKR